MKIPTTTVTVTRSIKAPPEAVYDVWADPDSPGSPWFGPAKRIISTKVDGLFFFGMGDGHDNPHYGRFLALDRPARIRHTWVSANTRGLESIVTIAFAPEGSGTLVTLTHEGIPDDEAGRAHEAGWAWVLGVIADKLAR